MWLLACETVSQRDACWPNAAAALVLIVVLVQPTNKISAAAVFDAHNDACEQG
jgi:hypothetical protein